jgi:predicted SAM-dependent methyltransferase
MGLESRPSMAWEDTAVAPEFLWCETIAPAAWTLPLSRAVLQDAGVPGVQFGCGGRLPKGVLNADLVGFTDIRLESTAPGRVYRVNEAPFLHHDVTQPLPVEDGAFDWAYSEHLIEHISQAQAVAWLKDVRRVVKPGGLLRLTTPDLERYAAAYAQRDEPFFAEHSRRLREFGLPAMPTRRAFMLNQIFQFWGHRWIYDFDELVHVLVQAGFAADAVERRAFQESAVAEAGLLDSEVRRDETLYVDVTT